MTTTNINTTMSALMDKINSILGVKSANAAIIPTSEESSDKYLSGTTATLLENIRYYPDGNAPTENNAWGNNSNWWVADKPCGFKSANPDGKETWVKLANNAADRYCELIAKKWRLNRDWLPDYKFSLEDSKQEVLLCVLTALKNGIDRSEINKLAFRQLDNFYHGVTDYKSELREEEANNGLRFMFAMLFTGSVDTLTEQLAYYDANGALPTPAMCPLPTAEDLEEIGATKDFEKLKVLFERTKAAHAANAQTWLCAQCYALGMPTEDALKFIYGDRAVGKKRRRSCEVAYSRHHEDVYSWLLEEVLKMESEGCADGLDKWVTIAHLSQIPQSGSQGEFDSHEDVKFDTDILQRAIDAGIELPF